ncbi:nucleoporin GLFG family protein [Abortiporus biennis]
MFGNTGISSTWGQPQQNQQQNQQQQGTSAFGQPASSGFGSGAFGSGGAFGQQQPQQQPQANPMFGNLGAGTSTAGAGTSGFGAGTGGGLFGAPKPATGFGAFGGGGTGTSTFGSGGAFGSTTAGTSGTGTGVFGSQPGTSGTSTFGSGGLFGGPKPTTSFGTTTQQQQQGTASPQYAVYDEKDTNSNVMLHYQSISCMPAYRGSSFEELRVQDYAQGRKTAGAFGQTTFGSTQPQQSSGGLFGQQQPSTTTGGGLFGGGGTSAFGNTANTTQPATTGFGTFGQTSTTQPSTGGGLFGGFGQQNQPQQQQTSAFGAFGQPQPQQQAQPATGGGLFGTGGAFGSTQTQPKPFGSFGTGTTFGGGGTFGQPAQQQQQPATSSVFGQPQQQTQQSSGGLFGQAAAKPSIFGVQPAQQQPNTGFGTGAFGSQPQQQQTQPGQGTQTGTGLFGGGGLFGQTQQQTQQQQQPQTGGGLFGTQPAQQQQPAGGLFGGGATGTGGGLFGNTSANQQQQTGQQPAQTGGFGGLFGNKPATTTPATGGGLFSGFGQTTAPNTTAPTQTTGGLFGSTLGQNTAQPANTGFGGGGLFGNKPATTPIGGQPAQSTAGAFGGSLFGSTFGGASNASQAPQQMLTASIAQPIAANIPIFNMLPPGPRAVTIEQPKKKSSLLNDLPTRSPVPRLQLTYSPASSKLRGFGGPTSGLGSSQSNTLASLTAGKPHALSLSKPSVNKSLLGPEAFLSSSVSNPALGSGGRQSVKKLILDKKVEPSDLFGKSQSPKITFNPALSVAARELEAASPVIPRTQSPAPASKLEKSGRFAATPPRSSAAANQVEEEPTELQEGDYYVKPDLNTLRKLSYDELVAFPGLVVGRVGYGEIHFLEPVDLTGLPKLGSLLGEIVRFDDKELAVYPDHDEADKPPPGTGLNVRARVMLVRCWALDKASREPIKDPKHPAAIRHLKRLKSMRSTHFEDFDVEDGKWTFTADHF